MKCKLMHRIFFFSFFLFIFPSLGLSLDSSSASGDEQHIPPKKRKTNKNASMKKKSKAHDEDDYEPGDGEEKDDDHDISDDELERPARTKINTKPISNVSKKEKTAASSSHSQKKRKLKTKEINKKNQFGSQENIIENKDISVQTILSSLTSQNDREFFYKYLRAKDNLLPWIQREEIPSYLPQVVIRDNGIRFVLFGKNEDRLLFMRLFAAYDLLPFLVKNPFTPEQNQADAIALLKLLKDTILISSKSIGIKEKDLESLIKKYTVIAEPNMAVYPWPQAFESVLRSLSNLRKDQPNFFSKFMFHVSQEFGCGSLPRALPSNLICTVPGPENIDYVNRETQKSFLPTSKNLTDYTDNSSQQSSTTNAGNLCAPVLNLNYESFHYPATIPATYPSVSSTNGPIAIPFPSQIQSTVMPSQPMPNLATGLPMHQPRPVFNQVSRKPNGGPQRYHWTGGPYLPNSSYNHGCTNHYQTTGIPSGQIPLTTSNPSVSSQPTTIPAAIQSANNSFYPNFYARTLAEQHVHEERQYQEAVKEYHEQQKRAAEQERANREPFPPITNYTASNDPRNAMQHQSVTINFTAQEKSQPPEQPKKSTEVRIPTRLDLRRNMPIDPQILEYQRQEDSSSSSGHRSSTNVTNSRL